MSILTALKYCKVFTYDSYINGLEAIILAFMQALCNYAASNNFRNKKMQPIQLMDWLQLIARAALCV